MSACHPNERVLLVCESCDTRLACLLTARSHRASAQRGLISAVAASARSKGADAHESRAEAASQDASGARELCAGGSVQDEG